MIKQLIVLLCDKCGNIWNQEPGDEKELLSLRSKRQCSECEDTPKLTAYEGDLPRVGDFSHEDDDGDDAA